MSKIKITKKERKRKKEKTKEENLTDSHPNF